MMHRTFITTFRALFLTALIGLPLNLAAQVPSVGSVSPRAVLPGQTTTLKLSGGNLVNTTQIWTSFPAQAVLTPNVANNNANAAEVTYDLNVPADAPPGLHGLRAVTRGGVSNLYFVFVDDLKSVAQTKPNDKPENAQVVAVPCAVDGQVDSLTRNYYKFTAAAGQKLTIEVWARRLGSPLDPILRLLDPAGKQIELSDDAVGLFGDSRLTVTCPVAGDYVVELRDIRFQGGDPFKYRLRIGDFPAVNVPFPLSVPRGVSTAIAFAGKDLAGLLPPNVQSSAPSLDWLTLGAKYPEGTSSGLTILGVSDSVEFIEQEPNNDAEHANPVELGQGLNGRFEQPLDVDRFTFNAAKGQAFTFSAITRQQGSPADLNLRLLKADGAQLAAAEDFDPLEDGRISFTFPEDGKYTLVATDLHGRGGSEFAYRIAVKPAGPLARLQLSADSLSVPQEGVALVTVTAQRHGYAGRIQLKLRNAPEGISLPETLIPAGKDAITATITSSGGLNQGSLALTQIYGVLPDARNAEIPSSLITLFRTNHNNLPQSPMQLTGDLALASSPRPPYVLRTNTQQIQLAKGLSYPVKVNALRAAEFNEAIPLATEPAKDALPAGVTAALKPVEAQQNQAEIVFAADDKAAPGTYNVVLAGAAKLGDQTIAQAAPSFQVTITDPFTLKVDPAAAPLKKGESLKLTAQLDRIPAFQQEVAFSFVNLPAGVIAEIPKVPVQPTAPFEIVLKAPADAPVGPIKDLQLKAEVTLGMIKHEKVLPVAVTVE